MFLLRNLVIIISMLVLLPLSYLEHSLKHFFIGIRTDDTINRVVFVSARIKAFRQSEYLGG